MPANNTDVAQMEPCLCPLQASREGQRHGFSGATPVSFEAIGRLAAKGACLPWIAGTWGRREGGQSPCATYTVCPCKTSIALSVRHVLHLAVWGAVMETSSGKAMFIPYLSAGMIGLGDETQV